MSLFGAVADHYVASPGASFASVMAGVSPTAWWRLGEASGSTAADASGNGHGGSYSNVVLGATGLVSGDSDTACSWPDSSFVRKVNVSYGSWMDGSTAIGGGILAAFTSSAIMSLIDRDDGTQRVFQFRVNAGRLEFIKVGGTGGIVTSTSPSGTTYNDGASHDFGFSYDGSSIRLYADGALVQTTSAAGNLGTATTDLAIGRRAGTAAQGYIGTLDEPWLKIGSVVAGSTFSSIHAAR